MLDEKTKQAIVLGREHYEKREYEQAERYLTEVLAVEHRYADVHNMMGVIHHDRGRIEEARLAFEHALALNPRYTEAALNLVVTYNDLGRYEDAQAVYRRSLEETGKADGAIDPFAKGKIANLHADLAQAYIDVGLSNEAVQEYRNAIRLCPEFADLRVKLAHLYRQTGDLPAAHYELGEAIRARPEYIPARVALGVVLFLSGRRDQAVAQWRQALEIAPDDRTAQLYLRGIGEYLPRQLNDRFTSRLDIRPRSRPHTSQQCRAKCRACRDSGLLGGSLLLEND